MKLEDQVYSSFDPVDWDFHLPLKFPPNWKRLAARLSSDDLISITWSRKFKVVAKYQSELPENKLVIHNSLDPDRISIAYNAEKDIATVLPSERNIRFCNCKCCAIIDFIGDHLEGI